MLCATFQVFKSKVIKFCHRIKLHLLKLVSNSLKLLRVTLRFVSQYMFRPVGHHLLSENCCTSFALFLYLIFSVQTSAAHYVFLVSHVLALCIAVTVVSIKILVCYITLCLTLHVSACWPSSGVVAVGKS
jgi:hypothetical protein